MSAVRITFTMPSPAKSPTEFRRTLLQRIRDAIAKKSLRGGLDAELAEEAFRALPMEEPRQ